MNESASDVKMKELKYDDTYQFVIVTLKDNAVFEENIDYVMTMNFSGFLNDNLRGFYRSVYQDEEGNDV